MYLGHKCDGLIGQRARAKDNNYTIVKNSYAKISFHNY